jgi:tRNA(fMet)-specific endonuclease VapC
VQASLPIEDYTLSVTRTHVSQYARLEVQAMGAGTQISAYDLMIVATAAATNRILLTTDAKAELNQLAGVRSEVISVH